MSEEEGPLRDACLIVSAVAMCLSVVSIILTSVWWMA